MVIVYGFDLLRSNPAPKTFIAFKLGEFGMLLHVTKADHSDLKLCHRHTWRALALVSGTIHLPTSGPYTAGAGDPSANIAAPIPPCFQPASPPSCDICGDRRIASCTWYTEARSGGVNEARSCSVIHRCETQADKICSAHRPASKLAAIAVGAILLSGRQRSRI